MYGRDLVQRQNRAACRKLRLQRWTSFPRFSGTEQAMYYGTTSTAAKACRQVEICVCRICGMAKSEASQVAFCRTEAPADVEAAQKHADYVWQESEKWLRPS
jgi:hypothetical protein